MFQSSTCRRRKKHIGKNTWSVTIVIFVRTGRQDWTQPVITSENNYSFMIFDCERLQRKFWQSRTLPSNFVSTKRVAKNQRIEGWRQMKAAFKLKKETRGTNPQHIWTSSSLFWTREVTTSRKPRPTNPRKTTNMGLLAVSIYERPKSKQKLQVISFNPNATATAVE